MRIIKLTAENFKKLRAVEITPDGHIVQITGANEQGKTTILECISMAVEGGGAMPDKPIRTGANRSRIKLELGAQVVEFIAEVKLATAKDGSVTRTLSLTTASGAAVSSPQKFLDGLVGKISFNPLEFARMKPRDQVDALKALAKIDVNFDELTALNTTDFTRRTEVNRDVALKRAQVEGIVLPATPPAAGADETALLNTVQNGAQHNASIDVERSARAQRQRDADQLLEKAMGHRNIAAARTKRIADLHAEIMRLQGELSQANQDAQACQDSHAAALADLAALPPLAEYVDVSAARAQLEQSKKATQARTTYDQQLARRKALEAEAEALQQKADGLTAAIAARNQVKADAIANAAMPVPGLGFGDGMVTYEGLPFSQASSAARLRISLAIAMAANPKLRVIRIDDGSLLDSNSLRMIAEMAKADDYQVWIEAVDESGQVGIVIEDGAVVSTPASRGDQQQAALI